MEITIKQLKTDDNNVITISCGKTSIKASVDSDEWNSNKINEMLIEIVTTCPDGEKLTINSSGDSNDQVFNYICELFKEFVDEYNKIDANE